MRKRVWVTEMAWGQNDLGRILIVECEDDGGDLYTFFDHGSSASAHFLYLQGTSGQVVIEYRKEGTTYDGRITGVWVESN